MKSVGIKLLTSDVYQGECPKASCYLDEHAVVGHMLARDFDLNHGVVASRLEIGSSPRSAAHVSLENILLDIP